MKIDKVEALKVDVPLDKSFGGGTYNVDRRTAIITKIYTFVKSLTCDGRFIIK